MNRGIFSIISYSIILILLALAAALLLLTGALTPMIADDYSLANLAKEHAPFAFLKWGYLTWGWGWECLLNWWMYSSPTAIRFSSCATGVIFLVSVYLGISCALGRFLTARKNDVLRFALILSVLWFCLPAIGQTIFMKAGASLYSLGQFLILTIIAFHCVYLPRAGQLSPGARRCASLFLFIVSFLAANIRVHLSAGLFWGQIAYLYPLTKANGWKNERWKYAGVLGAGLGGFLFVISPGSYARFDSGGASGIFEKLYKVILYYLLQTFSPGMLANVNETAAPAIFFWALLCVALYWTIPGARIHPRSIFLFVTGAVSFLVMLCLPSRAALRTSYTFVFCSALALYSLVPEEFFDFTLKRGRAVVFSLMVSALLLVAVSDMAQTSIITLYYHMQFVKRVALIQQRAGAGEKDIKVPAIQYYPNSKAHFDDITDDPKNWINLAVARYYGVNSIVAVESQAPRQYGLKKMLGEIWNK
ncbi:MAG: DUF6056 family protein [Candidatus Sumerlaeota bacterium]|nr:DUF6056 family protein [Candidatus Sumerlaeota bacterium]